MLQPLHGLNARVGRQSWRPSVETPEAASGLPEVQFWDRGTDHRVLWSVKTTDDKTRSSVPRLQCGGLQIQRLDALAARARSNLETRYMSSFRTRSGR